MYNPLSVQIRACLNGLEHKIPYLGFCELATIFESLYQGLYKVGKKNTSKLFISNSTLIIRQTPGVNATYEPLQPGCLILVFHPYYEGFKIRVELRLCLSEFHCNSMQVFTKSSLISYQFID